MKRVRANNSFESFKELCLYSQNRHGALPLYEHRVLELLGAGRTLQEEGCSKHYRVYRLSFAAVA